MEHACARFNASLVDFYDKDEKGTRSIELDELNELNELCLKAL
jgi:hypothetical protein